MEDEKTPAFNSSLAYLDRIGWLLRASHLARSNTIDDFTDDFVTLDSLSIELDPRMDGGERWMDEILRERCRRVKNSDNLRDWFVFLNRLAHSKGLIMKDESTLPGVIKG